MKYIILSLTLILPNTLTAETHTEISNTVLEDFEIITKTLLNLEMYLYPEPESKFEFNSLASSHALFHQCGNEILKEHSKEELIKIFREHYPIYISRNFKNSLSGKYWFETIVKAQASKVFDILIMKQNVFFYLKMNSIDTSPICDSENIRYTEKYILPYLTK